MLQREELQSEYPNGKWQEGLFLDNGTLRGINHSEYVKGKYGHIADPEGIYIPPTVERIEIADSSFNFLGTLSEWIMTTSVKYISTDNFLFFGIEKFIIRDQKTDECIFTTARFDDGKEDFDMPAFETFCIKLNRNPSEFYEECRAGKYADRPKTDLAQRKMEKEQASMEQIGKDCVYQRLHQLVGPLPPYYGPSKPVIKKKVVIPLEQTGLTYTVTLTTKPKSEPEGNKKYDLYEAIAHYESGNDIVIDSDAKKLEYDALLKRWCLWDNILYALSNENTMREVLEMAQKKKDGTLMSNRIVRIACDGIVTDKGNTLQFIAKPKDGKTLEIYPKARTFNPSELVLIETDYFSSHPEYWAEWLA